MNFIPRVLESHINWGGANVADPNIWTVKLTSNDHRELDLALKAAKAISTDFSCISCDDFPLDNLAAKLAEIEVELIEGRGFVVISSLKTDQYSVEDLSMIYWGISMYLGNALHQDQSGLLMGDVRVNTDDINDPLIRINKNGPIGFEYHSDHGDLIGLMCLRQAKSGGVSCLANAVAIHNELIQTRPDFSALLYEAMPIDNCEQDISGHFSMVPCFTEHEGRLFARLLSILVHSSQLRPDAPRLSSKALEAIDTVVKMANDPKFNVYMTLQPGDMQFINNYHVFHGRTAYIDAPESGQIRHLKRVWLTSRYLKSCPDYFCSI